LIYRERISTRNCLEVLTYFLYTAGDNLVPYAVETR